MSSTLIRWTEPEEQALAAVQARLQALVPSRTLERTDVMRALVQAALVGVTPDEYLTAHPLARRSK